MLDRINSDKDLSKQVFDARVDELRVDLLNAQFDLQSADFNVVLLVAGDDRLAVNSVTRLLHEWMDGRYLQANMFLAPSAEERERPRSWRYWRVMPPKGRIGLYVGAWGQNAISERSQGLISDEDFQRRLEHNRRFEYALVADGTLVLKYWLHLPRKHLQRRMMKAAMDETASWQLDEIDWRTYEYYDEALPHIETMLDATSTDACPWTILPGHRPRARDIEFGETLLDAITRRLDAAPEIQQQNGYESEQGDALARVDLGASLKRKSYVTALTDYQVKLAKLSRNARRAGRSSVMVFEGWDAAGKGGAIRRVTRAMALRDYRIAPVAAPTEEELARHYLWRFWRRMTRAGHMLIFDRSWYGRVLVERVEELATPAEWQRAYNEIVDFETQLVDHGIILCKFWLHIDREEQASRFAERETTPFKKYKITDEDYRNRDRWDDYVAAVNDMVYKTGTAEAPWHVVPANSKRFARVEVLKVICDAYERALDAPLHGNNNGTGREGG